MPTNTSAQNIKMLVAICLEVPVPSLANARMTMGIHMSVQRLFVRWLLRWSARQPQLFLVLILPTMVNLRNARIYTAETCLHIHMGKRAHAHTDTRRQTS
jgi:hypothetical protein